MKKMVRHPPQKGWGALGSLIKCYIGADNDRAPFAGYQLPTSRGIAHGHMDRHRQRKENKRRWRQLYKETPFFTVISLV